MERTRRLLITISLLMLTIVVETGYLSVSRTFNEKNTDIIKSYVSLSGIFLPAFYNETPFTRHSNTEDIISIFPHDPFMSDTSFSSMIYRRQNIK